MSQPLPSSQRAAQFTASHPLKIKVNQVATVPAIPKSGVYTFVRILSAGVNPVDYKIATLPWPIPKLMIGSAPITPGIDFVGRVWQTTHPDLKAGDICWGKHEGPVKHGSCADFTLHQGLNNIVKVPKDFLPLLNQGRSLDEFAGAPIAGLTALQALKQGDLPYNRSGGTETGGKVFINGSSGGTGTFTVQMAKAMGCDQVVATCSGANAEFVKSLGADQVIDYRSKDVVQALKDWAAEDGGQSFDLIIDNVGLDPSLYWNAHHYLKPNGGKFITVGASPNLKSILDLTKMSLIPGWLGGGKRPYMLYLLKDTTKDEWELIGKWIVEGKVRTIIEEGNVFDLADVQKAFDKLLAGRTRGKIVVKVNEDQH